MWKPVELIAAVGEFWEMGLINKTPWTPIVGYEAFKKSVIQNKGVVVGRKTWESMSSKDKDCDDHHKIILTGDFQSIGDLDGLDFPRAHVQWDVGNWTALEWALNTCNSPIFKLDGMVIAGGNETYQKALERDIVDVIHLAVIPRYGYAKNAAQEYEKFSFQWPCDKRFPWLNRLGWILIEDNCTPPRAKRMPPEDGAPCGWRMCKLLRNRLHPALDDRNWDKVDVSNKGVWW